MTHQRLDAAPETAASNAHTTMSPTTSPCPVSAASAVRLAGSQTFGHTMLLTAADVAKILNVSPSWVREHSTTKTPRLPVIKLGSGKTACTRYHLADIMEFIETQRKMARTKAAGVKWSH
jgi:hypothetical protein